MEQWERWVPRDDIPQRIYLQSFVDDENWITIRFTSDDPKKKVIVHFDGYVQSYRNTDEGSLIKTWEFLNDHYGVDFYGRWPFFKVKGSEYLDWFIKQSSGIYDPEEVEHYVFKTPNDIVEVLSTFEPDVIIE